MLPMMPVGVGGPYNLQRFVDAQHSVFEHVIAELKQGRKRDHWIWFIFPQLKGLGHNANSEFYGVSGLPEAVIHTGSSGWIGRGKIFTGTSAPFGSGKATASPRQSFFTALIWSTMISLRLAWF